MNAPVESTHSPTKVYDLVAGYCIEDGDVELPLCPYTGRVAEFLDYGGLCVLEFGRTLSCVVEIESY